MLKVGLHPILSHTQYTAVAAVIGGVVGGLLLLLVTTILMATLCYFIRCKSRNKSKCNILYKSTTIIVMSAKCTR